MQWSKEKGQTTIKNNCKITYMHLRVPQYTCMIHDYVINGIQLVIGNITYMHLGVSLCSCMIHDYFIHGRQLVIGTLLFL